MTLTNRIDIDPDVMRGKPVICCTRIPFELVLLKLSEGTSEGDLVDACRRLTREDTRAAIRYAADTLARVKWRSSTRRSIGRQLTRATIVG